MVAGSRRQSVELGELLGSQVHRVGADVLLEPRHPLGPGDRCDVVPCARSQANATCAGVAPTSRATVSPRHAAQVGLEVLLGESGIRSPKVGRIELVDGADGAGQHPAAERRVGDEPDTQLAQRAAAPWPQGRASRASTRTAAPRPGAPHAPGGCVRSASDSPMWRTFLRKRARPRRRQSPRWACRDRPGAGSRDRCGRCRAGGATLHCHTDVRRELSRWPGPPSDVRDHAELGGEDHLVASALEGAAHQLLVRVGPVDLSRVDEGDAEFQRPMDGADGIVLVRAPVDVGRGHAHGPQPDPGDLYVSKHDVGSSRSPSFARHTNRLHLSDRHAGPRRLQPAGRPSPHQPRSICLVSS